MNVREFASSWLMVENVALRFMVSIGLLGTGAQDGHLDFHTAPELTVVGCKDGSSGFKCSG